MGRNGGNTTLSYGAVLRIFAIISEAENVTFVSETKQQDRLTHTGYEANDRPKADSHFDVVAPLRMAPYKCGQRRLAVAAMNLAMCFCRLRDMLDTSSDNVDIILCI
jgi:hypothetical protein